MAPACWLPHRGSLVRHIQPCFHFLLLPLAHPTAVIDPRFHFLLLLPRPHLTAVINPSNPTAFFSLREMLFSSSFSCLSVQAVMSVFLFVCSQFVRLPVCLSLCLSVVSVHLPVCLSVCLSVCRLCVSARLSICRCNRAWVGVDSF